MEQRREKIVFAIGILFWAVVSVGFCGIGEIYILLSLAVLCMAQGVLNQKLMLDKESVLLLAGMLVYSIGCHMDFKWIFKVTFLPFLFYYYGKAAVVLQKQEKCEQRTKILVIVVSLGLFLGSVLNAVSWYKYGFENGRAWGEFWTGRRLPATQHVFWDLLIISLVFYGILFWKKARIINGIIVMGGLWSLWFSLITGSRTLMVIFVMVLGINIILYGCLNWNDEKKRYKIKRVLIGALLLCVLAVIAYLFNVGGISDFMKNSMWGRNGGILHNIRFKAQISVVKQLFEYPFGGRQMDLAGLNSAHNVWLDIANSAGLLPFILIIVYTVVTVYDLVKLIRNQTVGQEVKYILVSAYVSLFLYYMVEPALDANIIYWAVWMLVCGLVKGNITVRSNYGKMDFEKSNSSTEGK